MLSIKKPDLRDNGIRTKIILRYPDRPKVYEVLIRTNLLYTSNIQDIISAIKTKAAMYIKDYKGPQTQLRNLAQEIDILFKQLTMLIKEHKEEECLKLAQRARRRQEARRTKNVVTLTQEELSAIQAMQMIR